MTFDRLTALVLGLAVILLAVAPAPTNTLEVISTQPNQVLQSGSSTFSKGNKAILFSRPFGAAPVCVCGDSGGGPAECASGAPSVSGVTFYGKNNAAAFSWICVGTL